MDVFSLRTAAVAAAVAFPIGAQAAPVGDTAVAFELHYLLEGRSAPFGRVNTVDRFVDRFYAMRQGAPAWWTNDGWSAAASAAIQRIGAAEEHGLRPGDYHFSRLQQAVLGSASSTEVPKGVAQAELLLTRAVLGYLEDVANGRIDPSEIGWEAHRTRRIDPPSALQRSLTGGDFAGWFASVGPVSEQYRLLRKARQRYAQIAATEWPVLPEGPTLKPGDRGPRVAVARRQLHMLEQLRTDPEHLRTVQRQTKAAASPVFQLVSYEGGVGDSAIRSSEGERQGEAELYDSGLEAAVRRFQERHGLVADGLIGAGTRAALNISPRERLREIDLNLERLRWLSDNPGDRYVMVNIPGYELTAYDGGALVDRMKVIVGEPDWETPIMSDYIVDLKFAPDWTIPVSIVEDETLPKVRRDPGYLGRSNIRVLDRSGGEVSPHSVNWHGASSRSYVFRQRPGPGNALGLIRFSLTNNRGIYLHDTPSRKLFDRSMRALSHGCIRVERPADLARYLLEQDPTWEGDIERMMRAPNTSVHHLAQSTPVHLVYLTATIDERGELRFFDDVYDRNLRLQEALDRASSRRRNLG